jgi:hypothetical protein
MAATLIGFTGFAHGAEPPESFPSLAFWEAMYSTRVGGGYKDNVFLAHDDPERSAFLSAGGEIILLRVAAMGPQFSFLAAGDVNRFLSVSHNESAAFSQAQLEQEFGASWKGSLAGEYFFQDQVVDVSISETNREAVEAFGHTLTVRPTVRRDLPQRFWLSLETPASRQLFDSPLDDFWEAGLKLTLGQSYGRDSHLALIYGTLWRFYDTEPARTATGQALTNETRQLFQQEVRVTWRHFWDESKHWRTTLALAGRINDENGGDYFDYIRPLASAQVQYRAKPWEITAETRVALYDFDEQTVSTTDLSKRRRTDWSAEIRLERQLGKYFRLIGGYEHEQAFSNDELETYSVNTVSGSLQWEF